MSAREWKRGDVAMVTTGHGGPCVSIREGMDVWICRHGKSIDARVLEARPLVAIDPEDREQVEALTDAYEDQRPGSTDLRAHMATALRSLVAPPKPDEPIGLGAVVEDNNGRTWVRAPAKAHRPWVTDLEGSPLWQTYDEFAAVRILSEGVTP